MSVPTGKKPFASFLAALPLVGAVLFMGAFLVGCRPKPEPAGPGVSWRETDSPILAESWPPTADTVWARYTFAYGTDLINLRDGSYVSEPLAITERRDGAWVKKALSGKMEKVAVQGVQPLDERAQEILKSGAQAEEYLLGLTALPDPNDPAAAKARAYYQAWFQYNGAFLDQVRGKHADFIAWVNGN